MRNRNASTRRNSCTRGSGLGIPVNREREWVGGRILAPAYVTDGEPYPVELLLWLELPDDLVLGVEVLDPQFGPAACAQRWGPTASWPL